MKVYGSMYAEFKNNKGLLSTFYYVWYFFRRAFYIANVILLRNWTNLQFALNFLHCAISLGFLGFYSPYVGRFTNFVAFYSESGTTVVFSLCASFAFISDSNTEDTVMWAAIGTIFSIMFVNYIDIVIS